MKTPTIDPEVALPQVKKMLYSLAWKFSQQYPISFEEVKAEAYYRFMKACASYKPGKGTKFSTWCYFWVWTDLKTLVMKRSSDRLSFVEMDDDMCGEAPLEVSEALELVRDLPNDARELFSLLCEAPKECLEGFRLLLHGKTDNNINVKRAIRFLKAKGKSVFDLQGLHGQLSLVVEGD